MVVFCIGIWALPCFANNSENSEIYELPEESLQYSISLLGIPAGTATMETFSQTLANGLSVLQLNSTAKSNDFISLFFPVNNMVRSTVNAHTLLPLHLLFQRREGTRHEDFDITFDHEARQVTILKKGERRTMPIPNQTHDGLSCLYFLRQMSRLVPGQSVMLTIHHDKNNYEVEVQVETIELVQGPWGAAEAIRLLAVMPFRGIFLNEGNIRFWLTNDVQRIPLKMEARVIVGSVQAVLESWPGSPKSARLF
ncbi:DUF3108 domain-containing protein [Candidatus Nitronereus thalassa]|uniref:DUF3108 domain-containing protein n=2 Tax=Candidatus Nitronereus thalassa TaxID=3020898 RepID=A0ABU3K4D1_9BACT|nr:DUF3108 domain-containing protein [Candidatus Nitronereus thalassa]